MICSRREERVRRYRMSLFQKMWNGSMNRPLWHSSLLSALILFHGCGGSSTQQTASISANAGPIVSSLDLETVPPGAISKGEIIITNTGGRSVTVKRVWTECDCVSSSLHDLSIKPTETARIPVTFDSSVEPNFRGQLAVPVEGRSASDEVVFRTTVRIKIVEPDSPRSPNRETTKSVAF